MIPTMTSSPKKPRTNQTDPVRVGVVVPHIFMQDELLPKVIFSPGHLALALVEGLGAHGITASLFTPGPVKTVVPNVTADLASFRAELAARGDEFLELLKKHPLTFVSLARQVQAELIAKAYDMANRDELDVVHIYTNEEDIALPFAKLCKKPVVFTHHDPFNFLVAYKHVFPKYWELNWISLSLAQRAGMPAGTNWVGNVYHGLDPSVVPPVYAPSGDYFAYLGRIVEPKGLHIAIAAVQAYNRTHKKPAKLKIAGKHYAGYKKDAYWQKHIAPQIEGDAIEYVGFLEGAAKAAFLGNARALLVPSLFAEPFGMVAIEALAAATPVIALDSGALPELITDGKTGFVVSKVLAGDGLDVEKTAKALADQFEGVSAIDLHACRQAFEARFTSERMCGDYADVYQKLRS
jgi:glycosyltransferase involved in cell wall biosynthesis